MLSYLAASMQILMQSMKETEKLEPEVVCQVTKRKLDTIVVCHLYSALMSTCGMMAIVHKSEGGASQPSRAHLAS